MAILKKDLQAVKRDIKALEKKMEKLLKKTSFNRIINVKFFCFHCSNFNFNLAEIIQLSCRLQGLFY